MQTMKKNCADEWKMTIILYEPILKISFIQETYCYEAVVGDYSTGSTFEEFAREAEGISRIGVLRADVDNLGQAIVIRIP